MLGFTAWNFAFCNRFTASLKHRLLFCTRWSRYYCVPGGQRVHWAGLRPMLLHTITFGFIHLLTHWHELDFLYLAPHCHNSWQCKLLSSSAEELFHQNRPPVCLITSDDDFMKIRAARETADVFVRQENASGDSFFLAVISVSPTWTIIYSMTLCVWISHLAVYIWKQL